MHTLGRHARTHALLAAGLVLAIAPEARADTPCVPSALLNLASSLTCTTSGDIILSGTTVSVTGSGTLDLTVRQGDTIRADVGFGALSWGATTITNNGTLAGYVAGVDVVSGTAIITNNGVIKSTATSDGSGIVIVGTGSATITNGATGVIQGTVHAGIMLSTTAPTTTITNYGNIISGGVLSGGIKISSANTATVDQYGVITATATGSAGIWLTAASARVNLNIREGSSFAGLGLKMDDPAYTGSTIRFYAANYSLSVQNFLLANHTVTAMSPGAHVDLVGADKANGNGNLVVYTPAPAPAPTMPAATAAAATAVQSAIQVSVPRNVVPTVPQAPPMSSSAVQTTLPVQNTLPEFGTAGSGATGGGSSASGGPSNLGMSESAMSNLGMRGTYDDTPRNAQAFDRYGNLVWARAFGSARFQRPSDDIAGSVNRTGGVLMGYDRQFTDWRLGVYTGYGLSYTGLSDGSAKLATDLYLGGLYARTKFAGYTLTANLGGGLLDNHSSRIINAGAEIAAAQFGGAFIAPDIAPRHRHRAGSRMDADAQRPRPLHRHLHA